MAFEDELPAPPPPPPDPVVKAILIDQLSRALVEVASGQASEAVARLNSIKAWLAT